MKITITKFTYKKEKKNANKTYFMLHKFFKNNKKTSPVYDCTVEDVELMT